MDSSWSLHLLFRDASVREKSEALHYVVEHLHLDAETLTQKVVKPLYITAFMQRAVMPQRLTGVCPTTFTDHTCPQPTAARDKLHCEQMRSDDDRTTQLIARI